MSRLTPFQRVSAMNTAFGNPQGSYDSIDWPDVRNQCKNIGHEFVELMEGLGLNGQAARSLTNALTYLLTDDQFIEKPVSITVRDALCDIQVFAQGGQHKMGVDGDADMNDVVDGVMTRFIKDEADKLATIIKHAKKGVTLVYFEGEYPTLVMKSAADQPDAPKGKFLKSASYQDTVFRYPPTMLLVNVEKDVLVNGKGKAYYAALADALPTPKEEPVTA